MSFKWTTNDIATMTISIYETNITLNKAACRHFEEVTHVLLGFDNEIYPASQLHRIFLGKSYGRITNKNFVEDISQRFQFDFSDKQCYKYQAKFDVIHQMMIIQL